MKNALFIENFTDCLFWRQWLNNYNITLYQLISKTNRCYLIAVFWDLRFVTAIIPKSVFWDNVFDKIRVARLNWKSNCKFLEYFWEKVLQLVLQQGSVILSDYCLRKRGNHETNYTKWQDSYWSRNLHRQINQKDIRGYRQKSVNCFQRNQNKQKLHGEFRWYTPEGFRDRRCTESRGFRGLLFHDMPTYEHLIAVLC